MQQIETRGSSPREAQSRPASTGTSNPTKVKKHENTAPQSTHVDLTGSIVNDKYNLLSWLSSGGESDLYVCSAPDGRICCLKLYFDSSYLQSEVREKLLTLKHKNILQLLDWGTWGDKTFEVFPLISSTHRNMEEMIEDGSIHKYDTKGLVRQMAEAIHALHEMGIIHQDIKPENFMISAAGEVLLIDFGISGHPEDGRTHVTVIGKTYAYLSPEARFWGKNRPESDYYSLGATAYCIIFGVPPFSEHDISAITNTLIPHLNELGKRYAPEIAKQYQDLLYGLLQFDCVKRWQYEAVVDWYNGNYTRWIIAPPRTAAKEDSIEYVLPAYRGWERMSFVIPEQLDALVKTMAVQWKAGALDADGRFSDLFIRLGSAPNIPNWEDLRDICNKSKKDLADEYQALYINNAYTRPEVVFFIKLYKLSPQFTGFGWNRCYFSDLSTLGNEMLRVLWEKEVRSITGQPANNNYSAFNRSGFSGSRSEKTTEPLTFMHLQQIASNHLVYHYYYLHKQDDLAKKVFAIESSIDGNKDVLQEGHYQLAYFLSGSSALKINSEREPIDGIVGFRKKVNSVIEACVNSNSNDPFISFCNSLCNGNELKPGFKAWAESQGYGDAINTLLREWRKAT